MKILVVDDSDVSRQLVIRCLTELDYNDIVQASDGKEALSRLHDVPGVALVLLDRYMPVMDGLEFMKRFKQEPAYRYIPVSMVTSEDDMGEKFKALAEYNADYYITKPVTVQSLVRMFAKLFPD